MFSTPLFAACIKGNCENGWGTFVWDNEDQYEGVWQDGKPLWRNQGWGTTSGGQKAIDFGYDKIDKYINITSDWNFYSIEEKVNDITDDIIILNESWDGGYPGGSGTMRYLFIKDWDKVSWIFDDLKIVYDRASILVEKVENSE